MEKYPAWLKVSSSRLSFPSAFALQEMYKASKYEVSPDMKHVLLAYNVAPVSLSFVCSLNRPTGSRRRQLGDGEDSGGEIGIMASCAGPLHTAARH